MLKTLSRLAPARLVVFAALTALTVAMPAAGLAGPLQDDLAARRERLMERLGPEAMAIIRSAPTRVYSLDVDYEYRQDSNLFYLTGIDQEETTLVLLPGSRSGRAVLFIRDADARREHWNGHSLTAAEATAASGIETVMPASRFEGFIAAMLSQRPAGEPGVHAAFVEALAQNRARIVLPLEPRNDLEARPGANAAFAAGLRERFFGFGIQDATPLVAALRQIKTPYEQEVMRKSVAISSDAHRAGMAAAAAGKYEYEVEAAIEAVYLRNGAMSWGYPSIVGSGPNATILHYQKSSRKMAAGDLLLVDAAASYQGYTGDITRTYPVDGTFTAAQRRLYDLVFAAQEAGIAAARIGAPVADVQKAVDEVVRAGLVKLGLVTDATGNQFKIWATHGVCHWIGLDVHDVGTRREFAAGMAFTIEPGIYIREAALEALPRTAENLAFIEKVRPLVAEYKDTGIRIEDSFLLTDAGLERLSSTVPRTADEVERFLAAERTSRR